jgi:hypothetical protein
MDGQRMRQSGEKCRLLRRREACEAVRLAVRAYAVASCAPQRRHGAAKQVAAGFLQRWRIKDVSHPLCGVLNVERDFLRQGINLFRAKICCETVGDAMHGDIEVVAAFFPEAVERETDRAWPAKG